MPTDTQNVVVENRTYMIAPRSGQTARMVGLQPMAAGAMDQLLSNLGLDVVRRIKRNRGTMETLGVSTGEATDIIVARIEPERAELLRQSVPPHLMIVEDKLLEYGSTVVLPRVGAIAKTAETKVRKLRFKVLGENDKPLLKVSVQLVGDAFPTQGLTDEKGEIELELITLGSKPPRLMAVTAPDSYWDIYLPNPEVKDDTVNLIRMRSLTETIPGFPHQFQFGWGQRLMGLNQVPKEITGAGIKIAIIDSGCDNGHSLLQHIRLGRDFTDDPDPNSWNKDIIGHGTHCAGIITARSVNGSMMHGFAPEAEIHILRVFPGGSYSSLIEALDYCIEHQIDVVNMSLGGDSEINPVVEQSLAAAALKGIACIVAAGNSGDAVKYPASSPQTFAVAAVGSLTDLQPKTWDSITVQQGLIGPNGIFSPSFTCFGPEIAVCAPGVSIISTVPGGVFKSESGTSMAAPHVTGLAALLLAHHPLFQTQFKARGPQRVAALFSMIRMLCTPYTFGSSRTGAGLPNLGPIIAALQAKPASTEAAAEPIPTAGIGFTPAAVDITPFSWPQFVVPQGLAENMVGALSPIQLNTAMLSTIMPFQTGSPFYIVH